MVLSATGTCVSDFRIQLPFRVALRCLEAVRGGILALSRHQFLMRTLLEDSARAQVDDSIGMAYRGQMMRDPERRAALAQTGQCRADFGFIPSIESSGRLV